MLEEKQLCSLLGRCRQESMMGTGVIPLHLPVSDPTHETQAIRANVVTHMSHHTYPEPGRPDGAVSRDQVYSTGTSLATLPPALCSNRR